MACPAFSILLRPAIFPRSSALPRVAVAQASLAVAASAPAPAMSLGFERLKETFMWTSPGPRGGPERPPGGGNVAVRVELRNGCVGWGEAPVLPSVTAEDQPAALAAAAEACAALMGAQPAPLDHALEQIAGILPGHRFASVRAGVEMALIDAIANSISVPLWRLFGGVSNSIRTDITIPMVSPNEAAELASSYRGQGFSTIKLKVLRAVQASHPHCSLILDANEGYTVSEAIGVLERLHEMGVVPALFEQPVEKDDWEGLGHVSHLSCRSLDDAYRIVKGKLAHVVNIKLAKLGLRAGLGLMIGGMVETRLAMGFAGHLAAGLGCFGSFDLDTPLLLSEDPVIGGYEVSGALYKFRNPRGHGGFLHWDNIHW
ncbi:unnamed protein product [Spirodela intermedia]|uniref:Mandelate racemase/muconate lactonizing enzyme C-terminal domain-containing protein n=1 Tax=Spirodela intermedia TaxID=51605 RepID=A0A7I8IU41_SPIIN|nr:unnamed protein product [Spirodela intermedia]CAA6661307.1 unnamed protein product [Spirodela intermedia]